MVSWNELIKRIKLKKIESLEKTLYQWETAGLQINLFHVTIFKFMNKIMRN